MNLKAELEHLQPQIIKSPWPGHEHVRGYGIFGLPLSSGHVLALRVFPVNDFAPYVTVWHMNPEGEWTIYYQAPRPDIACPRYYGAAAKEIIPARIQLEWINEFELRVEIKQYQLEWTVRMKEPAIFHLLNKVNNALPFWTWKSSLLLKMREWIAQWLGMGKIKLSGKMPSGHFGILMPQRMFPIDWARVSINEIDLGTPVKVRPNPKIGEVPLPARGVFAIGQAHWEIINEKEYRDTRAELGVLKAYLYMRLKEEMENDIGLIKEVKATG
jgi:hypothetical protein